MYRNDQQLLFYYSRRDRVCNSFFRFAFASPFSAHFNRHKVGKYRKSIIQFNNFLMQQAKKKFGYFDVSPYVGLES